MKSREEIIKRFLGAVERDPAAPAIFHRDAAVTYGELGEMAIAIAAALKSGRRRGPVAVHLNRTPKLVASLLACWHAGLPFVAMDPKHPSGRKREVLLDSAPSLILSEEMIDPPFQECEVKSVEELLRSPYPLSAPSLNGSFDLEKMGEVAAAERELAYILYTSGSTGKPKGISISEGNVGAFLSWAHEVYDSSELSCVLAATTVTFDLSIFELFAPLTSGGSLLLIDSMLDLTEPSPLYEKISLINTVPSAMREVVNLGALPNNVKVVNLAGEALEWSLVEKIYTHRSIEKVYNCYGPSEDTTYSTYHLAGRKRPGDRGDFLSVPIGKAIAGSKAVIVDEALSPVADGEVGEICLYGKGVALGYHRNSALTAEKFIEQKEGRLYRTGDLGYVDEAGDIHYKGRVDDQVKVRGYRIELGDIESHLLLHGDILQALAVTYVVAGQKRLAAGLQVKSASLAQEEVVRFLSDKLPGYMIPQQWHISTEAMARTASGKLCRTALARYFTEERSLKSDFSSPQRWVEELLGREVDLSKSFVDQGGDSLSALRLLAEWRSRGSRELSLKTLLDRRCPLDRVLSAVAAAVCESASEAEGEEKGGVSDAERRMWRVMTTTADGDSYNVSVEFAIKGAIDREKLAAACKAVVDGEPMLRRNYFFDGGELRRKENKEHFSVVTSLGEMSFEELSHELYHKPFDLEKELPCRIALIERGSEESSLLLSLPHTAIDGLGIDALLRKISKKYAGIEVKAVPFVEGKGDRNKALDYWKGIYSTPVATLNWPTLQGMSRSGATLSLSLDKEQRSALVAAAKRENVTLPALLLAFMKLALYRMQMGKELVVATPVANREKLSQSDVVANTTNSLPIRTAIGEEMRVGDLVAGVCERLIEALEYQTVQIDAAISELFEGREREAAALFDLFFSYMQFGVDTLQLEGAAIARHFPIPQKRKAPLLVSAIESSGGAIELRLEVDPKRVPDEFAQTLLNLYHHLLLHCDSAMNLTVADDALLPKEALLLGRNALLPKNEGFYRRHLMEWFTEVAKERGEMTAVVDGEVGYSYRALYRDAQKVAEALLRRGVEEGTPIGLYMDKSKELIAAIFGVLFAGCHYVPLAKNNPKSRLMMIIEDSALFLAISDSGEWSLPCDRVTVEELLAETGAREATGPRRQEILGSPSDNAYIIYTSGTTGKPKGVAITHENVATMMHSCSSWGNFSPSDVWTFFHSYAFDFSVWEIFGALLYGGKLVIVPEESACDPTKVAELIEKWGVTLFSQTPTAFKNFLLAEPKLSTPPRMIVFGGEALYRETLSPWFARFGEEATKLINMYGITEITVHATLEEITSAMKGSSIGRPLAHMGIAIIGEEGLPCPPYTVGEIWLTGAGLSSGYLNDEAMNSKKFVDTTLYSLPSRRYYRSGDTGYMRSDGRIEAIGRIDKQLKINGYRIETAEVLGAIASLEEIDDAFVCKKEEALVAYYLSQKKVSDRSFYERLSHTLPPYALPTRFIPLKRMPLTVNGKVDFDKLPDPDPPQESEESPIKELVAGCWRELLDHRKIGEDTPFFEAGGNSLKALRLLTLLNARFEERGVKFTLVDIFRYPTIRQQSDRVEKQILTMSL